MRSLILVLVAALSIPCLHGADDVNARRAVIRGCIGTYGTPARLPDGHADVQKLLTELQDIKADTFHWAIHSYSNDWSEIQTFLPLARQKNIKVWITLVPPSESPPKSKAYSEPFRLDYVRWATEIAKLSVREPNLVAWSIDDFTHNLSAFTPECLGQMMTATHEINPRLAFVPCCYYKTVTNNFAPVYGPLLDGVLFPYRDESGGGNLKNPGHLSAEVKTYRDVFGPDMPIVLDVYATAHSRLGPTTPEYVDKVVREGLKICDGVLIYKHQDPQANAEKYQIIRKLFRAARNEKTEQRGARFRGSLCTYAAAPMLPDGHVDVRQLIEQLLDLHANTYRWVFRGETNFQDLKMFLPLAREKNIRVWVTVNPPSERPKGTPAEQMHAEYQQWAVDFAKLSLTEPNFVAWSIDDFVWNLKFFTPEEVEKILAPARAMNPKFAFIPCCYYKAVTPQFVKDYGRFCDGVMFPYRDESAGANLHDSTHVKREVETLRKLFGPERPIVVGVFASRHSKLGLSKTDYVEKVMSAAHDCAAGISVYRHPNRDSDPEKYAVVKKLFTSWSDSVPPKN